MFNRKLIATRLGAAVLYEFSESVNSVKLLPVTQKIGKKEETLTNEMKRSPDERHTQTHGSLIEKFRITNVFLDHKKSKCM